MKPSMMKKNTTRRKSMRLASKKKRHTKPVEGFSARELCKVISELYEINPSKYFKSQVKLALKRGVNYGLLVKKRNKYRYDMTPPPVIGGKVVNLTAKKIVGKNPRSGKPKILKASSSTKSSKGGQQQEPERKYVVPRPTVPPPPNWKENPRNLLSEPYAKVIKRPGN